MTFRIIVRKIWAQTRTLKSILMALENSRADHPRLSKAGLRVLPKVPDRMHSPVWSPHSELQALRMFF